MCGCGNQDDANTNANGTRNQVSYNVRAFPHRTFLAQFKNLTNS